MSLDRYRCKVIMMNPTATAHEAACAMFRHQIGAVLVGQHGLVNGMVTDRDLALLVVAAGSDPKTTTLKEVMSEAVDTVEVTQTIEDVTDVMFYRACRRVPVTEGGKVVGIVTLDDLVADGSAPADALALVVQIQLAVASLLGGDQWADPGSLERTPRAQLRHERRVENSLHRLLNAVQAKTGLTTPARAATALRVVLGAMCRRLKPSDAQHLLSQLPSTLRDTLQDEMVGPDRTMSSTVVIERLAKDLNLNPSEAAGVLSGIGEVICKGPSAEQAPGRRVHWPSELEDIFPAFVAESLSSAISP
jgi:CBS domain-containing protein